jgi:hypothetical protein
MESRRTVSSGSDEIRSALDIAMERAARLGSISSEEKQRSREQELAAAGEAMAKRCLSGLPFRDAEVDLAGRSEEARETITRHLLACLAEIIDITQPEGSEKALAVIEHFSGDPGAVRRVRDVLSEYRDAAEKARQENAGALETAKKKELESKGISGPAVVPAIETSPEWLLAQERLAAEYRERLSELLNRWTGPRG